MDVGPALFSIPQVVDLIQVLLFAQNFCHDSGLKVSTRFLANKMKVRLPGLIFSTKAFSKKALRLFSSNKGIMMAFKAVNRYILFDLPENIRKPDFFLVSLLLTMNKFHTLLWCRRC